ncbi:fibronectin type III domain-containing protein [Prosthecobacter sp.]|uniref:fibronectin type III domain-containing protein n=1 Tax=Prosthecobacter sp. TaxID=1965333 RepID=UPI00378453FF
MNKLVVIRVTASEAAVAAWTDLRVMMVLGCFAAAVVLTHAAAPDWWSSRGLVKSNGSANDYAVANQGQLKNMVRAACDELVAKGYIDTSHPIYLQVQSWRTNSTNAKDYSPVNLGQLKAVAKPIYDVLKAKDSSISYPWSPATTDDKDYGVANVGQLKNVFGFNIPELLQAPANLSAGSIMPNSVVLTWQDTNTVEDGYRIDRSTNNVTFAPVTTTTANQNTFSDTGLAQNSDYYYKVVAVRATAASPPSNVVHVKTLLDSDHDGIPDDWEIAHGLNPNNASDAGLSLSRDGLTALDNYLRWMAGNQYGIDPQHWDLDPNGDEDHDGVLNFKDANPMSPAVGQLNITITSPAGGTSF